MTSHDRVWISPNSPEEVNLNQTALHSENPLKDTKIKSTVLPLDSSTDFLLTTNINNVLDSVNAEKLADLSREADNFKSEMTEDGKSLPPRKPNEVHVSSGSNFHPSDLHVQVPIITSPLFSEPQDIVQLKHAHLLTGTNYSELEPSDKECQKMYTAVRMTGSPEQNFIQLLDACGIECREEIVEIKESPDNKQRQTGVENGNLTYVPGQIVCGGREALEMLAQDVSMNKLKTGVHGIITNKAYGFLTDPKSAQERQKILGRGGNGKVDLWNYQESQFVTKTIFRDFRPNEVLFTNLLSHEFIVKSHGLIIRDGQPQIVMDYADDNLLHYGLSKNVEEGEIWNFTYQILEALEYLHGKQIRHFDVKPENIVLKEDEFGHKTLKLADFGGATLFTEDVDCLSWTPAYMAPEMCQFYLNRQFPKHQAFTKTCGAVTEKCDIYSLALSILFMYVKGHILIKHVTKGMQNLVGPDKADAVSMKIVIMNAKDPTLGSSLIPPNVGKDMRTLLSYMLTGKVDDRLTARHLMDMMKDLATEVSHTVQPKKIIRRKSRSTENRPKVIRPKIPKLIVVTIDRKGKQVNRFSSDHFTGYNDGKQLYGNSLDTSEQQRPLRDLNIDLQVNSLLDQANSIEDVKMKQVVEEENRPLLKRLVKRKLKEKVNEDRAFKMTKMMEELQSSASSSASSIKENTSSLSRTVNPVHAEPEYIDVCIGPGNIPNFDILDF